MATEAAAVRGVPDRLTPDLQAALTPDKPALILAATGATLTFGALVGRARALAAMFQAHGIGYGDHVAVLLNSRPEALEIAWAAQRVGAYYTFLNETLDAAAIVAVLRDNHSKAFIAAATLVHALDLDHLSQISCRVALDEPLAGFVSYDTATRGLHAPQDEIEGSMLAYTSGSTGKPKGVKRALPRMAFGEWTRHDLRFRLPPPLSPTADAISLVPAPLHFGPGLGRAMLMTRAGGTVVMMDSFDASPACTLIGRHRITNLYLRPFHLLQLLKLPEAAFAQYDLSSLRYIVHAGGPLPIAAKEQLIARFGPIIYEQYSSSEAIGHTYISSEEWLAHKGSVGRASIGDFQIFDNDGNPLPRGTIGLIYGHGRFAYANRAELTASAYRADGTATVGDLGYVDADGYLYIVDRAANVIGAAAGPIYPQDIENALAVHPAVSDVAVVGLAKATGEQAIAFVVPRSAPAAEALADELAAYCRGRLPEQKWPAKIVFLAALPRSSAGKLLRNEMQKQAAGMFT